MFACFITTVSFGVQQKYVFLTVFIFDGIECALIERIRIVAEQTNEYDDLV